MLVGKPAFLEARTRELRLQVTSPAGVETTVQRGDADKVTKFSKTDVPGFYRVSKVTDEGASERWSHADFAVNLDPRASDIRPRTLPSVHASGSREQSDPLRRIELWHAIAAALMLFLLIESILVLR